MHQLERRVLEMIGEDPDNPDVFTDTPAGIAPIRDSLNEAIQEIIVMTGSNKRDYMVPLRGGQQLYRINPKRGYLGWITDVFLVTQKRRLEQVSLKKVTKWDPRWMKSNASPRAYIPLGADLICFYPKPSADEDIAQLTIVEIPIDYADEKSKLRIKEDFEYAAVEYAVADYWAGRGDAQEATKHFNLYLGALGLRDDFNIWPGQNRQLETNKEMRPTETS